MFREINLPDFVLFVFFVVIDFPDSVAIVPDGALTLFAAS